MTDTTSTRPESDSPSASREALALIALAEKIQALPPADQAEVVELICRDSMDETIVLIPEVRIPADFQNTVKRARKLAAKLTPRLAEMRRLALEVRDAHDGALRALGAAGVPLDGDQIHDVIGEALGWTGPGDDGAPEGVWDLVTELHDLLSDGMGSGLATTGLSGSELARFGEADVPVKSRAMVPLPAEEGGEVVEMIVCGRPSGSGLYTLVRADAPTGPRYSAPHDEVKAGLVG